ncbi:MAG TPA: YceI family protein [Gammaproteobacteria bacterium]
MIFSPSTYASHQRYRISWPFLVLLGLLLAGCQAAPEESRTANNAQLEPAPPLPGTPVHVVDPTASYVRVLVWRDGALSAFGHNHVLIAPVSGKVHVGETAARSGFDLAINVKGFVVDPAKARAEEGEAFASDVSDEARLGTRENLLGEDVLNADCYPRIGMRSVSLNGPRRNPEIVARLTLHGVTRDIEFPAEVFVQEDRVTVLANFTILQSDFGIEPFSVFGGGLSVRDAVDVRVKLVARRQ